MLEMSLSILTFYMIYQGAKSIRQFDKEAEKEDLLSTELKDEACHLVDEYVAQVKDPGDIHTAMRRRNELEDAMLRNHEDRNKKG